MHADLIRLPFSNHNYLAGFRSFDALARACFSHDLDLDYKQKIQNFRTAWTDLKQPIVCKIHLLYGHLDEELEQLGRGTALFKKSAGESLHADFNRHYQGYLVKM